MLFEVLNYLHNWFLVDILSGTFTIQDGEIADLKLLDGQYFRIVGSILNDGVYQSGEKNELKDETWTGAIWELAIPRAVIELVTEIEEWQARYGAGAAAPYVSESFGGYSYTKAGTSGSASWQTAFAARLAPYRKLAETAGPCDTAHQDPPYRRPFVPGRMA